MDYKELEKKYYPEGYEDFLMNDLVIRIIGPDFIKALEAERKYYSKSLDRVIKDYEEYKEKVKKNLES